MSKPTISHAPDVPTKNSEVASALAYFVVSSVGMMLGNKKAVSALPLPCTLMLIQMVSTVVLLQFSKEKERICLANIKRWLPVALLFTAMLFTSLQSFLHASVSSILVFRNAAAIVSTVVDYQFRGIGVNTEILLSEACIVVGAYVYGASSLSFTYEGLFWMLTNVAAQVFYGVYLKREMEMNPAVRGMSKFTMSLYNNTLAVPFVLAVFAIQGEHNVVMDTLFHVTPIGWVFVAVTCVLGYLISTSGFGLQKMVSATGFIVVNNLAKFLNIVLGMIFLNEKLSGSLEWTGCVLAFAGGFWYSMASMRFNNAKAKVSK